MITSSRSANASAPLAVIFDLDGTLVDSEPNYFEASRAVLAHHGVRAFGWDDHLRFVGIGTLETLETLRRENRLDVPVDELLAELNRAYLELAGTRTETFPRMRTYVERLYGAGVPLAVASGSSRRIIRTVLECVGLTDRFAAVVSAEEVPRGKPEPDVFLEAARRLGAEPRGCVVVEDAPPGAEAAHRAGMRCVGVPYAPTVAADPAFRTAGLLFPGGQGEFDAERAYTWVFDGRGE
ncbi:HAD family hydrolase [Streptomyces abikoensis]|uniref:HAD family hydrolase n=1 Tax=Streptomyces abikoensis TaxID=97398 RepID=UPI001E5B8C30|nr:HAD family phosphatase [Streptomyces abikoensis]